MQQKVGAHLLRSSRAPRLSWWGTTSRFWPHFWSGLGFAEPPSLPGLKTGFFQSRAFAHSKCYAMSSPPTTPMSQASTRFGLDSSISLEDVKVLRRRAVERVKQVSTSQDIFLFLVAFRILNALSVKTFFQPDEYFQSLEPAWQIAFGKGSGAWITWVNNTARREYNS